MLLGNGMLAIWNHLDPDQKEDWVAWHTREHIPERIETPGFLRARRYVDETEPDHPWFTLYEVESLDILGDDEYLARLDEPTPWSRERMGAFRKYLRSACGIAVTRGHGVGGHLATLRVYGDAPGLDALAVVLAEEIEAQDGIVGAHYGRNERTRVARETVESRLRGNAADGQAPYDALFLIDALDHERVTSAATQAVDRIAAAPGVQHITSLTYRLQFELSTQDESARQAMAATSARKQA